MVLSNVLHGSRVNGVSGASHSLGTSISANRAVMVSNKKNEYLDILSGFNSSATTFSNGYYYSRPPSSSSVGWTVYALLYKNYNIIKNF